MHLLAGRRRAANLRCKANAPFHPLQGITLTAAPTWCLPNDLPRSQMDSSLDHSRRCKIVTVSLSQLRWVYNPATLSHTITMIFLPKPNKTPFEHINYRPISLLEVPGKIFEKLFNKRLLTLLDDRGLHNKRQHGFRPKRGTDTALAILHETVATHRGNLMSVDWVFRHISWAFDKVWHDGLRSKLRTAQLSDTMTRILSNYLADRTATVRIGDYFWQTFQLKSGVPQSGCLSPTLLNLYNKHDMTDPCGNTEYIAYADDVTQIIPQRSKSAALHSLQTTRAIKTYTTLNIRGP